MSENVEQAPFAHYIVELSLREVVNSKGETVTLCVIEANEPLNCEGEESGLCYRWDRIMEAGKALDVESGCFCLVLVPHCCGDMGVFTIAHSRYEEPVFHILVHEDGELVAAKPSGVSMDLKADFRFAWFNAQQKMRIETIPDIETYWKAHEPLEHRKSSSQDVVDIQDSKEEEGIDE